MQIKLKVLGGTHEGKEIAIKQDKFLIGRSESCQLRPKSESISRKHCALVQKDGRLLVLDLKSRNGTFVNDKQLSPEKAKILKNGDHLRVGQLEFEVVIEVGLGGAKKPEVKDVKEAAQRVAETSSNDSRYVEIDINSWLEEADQVDRSPAQDTRQFVLEETNRIEMTIAASNDETSLDNKDSSADSVESSSESAAAGPPEAKKGPMKLPKMTKGPTSKTSRDAANETLKKYFGGR